MQNNHQDIHDNNNLHETIPNANSANSKSDSQVHGRGLFADKAYKPTPQTQNSKPAPASFVVPSTKTDQIEQADADGFVNKDQTNDDGLNHNPISTQDVTLGKKITTSNTEPLKLAVVGHTNTGKTSLLRTLLRDVYFGEVKNEAATTRHVERAYISNSQTGENLIALFDTPGLEDASGVMDWLEDNTASRRDGIERLQQFLASPVANADTINANANTTLDRSSDDFSQEAKVIRQLLASDMAIYVVDAREPVLGKYKDELAVLSWSATPVMPVFNFTDSQDANIEAWQDMLARRGLHVSTRFDSVAFEFEDEMTLWQNLATMLTHPQQIDTLIASRQSDWERLYEEATIIIADFLLNIASTMREINEDADPTPVLTSMQEGVRQTERSMQKKLLDLYKFYDNTAVMTSLELTEYQQDPFDSELIKSYGIRTTSGATIGALVGAGIDVATLGTTLGLGTALGGLAGGLLSNTTSIADKITGVKRLYVDPATLTLLATRSLDLLCALRHRGHATNKNSPIAEFEQLSVAPWDSKRLPSELKKARSKPQWSTLNQTNINNKQAQELRADAAWTLSRQLRR